MTGPSMSVRFDVRARSNGLCLRCGRPGHHVHHRRPRKMGGTNRPSINYVDNLALLCVACHTWVESHRTEAYAAGWLIPESGDEPEQIPLTDLHGARFFLTRDGAIIHLNGETA